MTRTKAVTLSQAVRVGGKDITEVTVRNSTIGDEEDALQDAVLMKRANNPLTIEMALLARMCGLPYDALRSLPSEDYVKLRSAHNSLSFPDEANPTPDESGTPSNS